MTYIRIGALAFTLLLAACLSLISPDALRLKVVNKTGFDLEIYWDNTINANVHGSLEPQAPFPLRNDSKAYLDTYRSHTFRLRIAANKLNAGPSEHVEVDYVVGAFETELTVNYVNGRLILEESTAFKEQVDDLKYRRTLCGDPGRDGYVECMSAPMHESIERITNINEDIKEYYGKMVDRYRNYTCADEALLTSDPIRIDAIRIGTQKLPAYVLLDTSHAKIWYINDFIHPSECEILKEYGRSRLERATVYDDKNGSFIQSNKRKAQQATYMVDGSDDPMAAFYYRLFGAINQRTNYGLHPDGQQGIALIQYNPGDEYFSHCDGACDGKEHIRAGRVATAVCYCEVPKRGGATTFSRAGVYIKPKLGTALFFSYLGDDGRMDRGLTDHSGCPVLEGEKWLATMWFRKGVTKDMPSYLFDAVGNLKSDSNI